MRDALWLLLIPAVAFAWFAFTVIRGFVREARADPHRHEMWVMAKSLLRRP